MSFFKFYVTLLAEFIYITGLDGNKLAQVQNIARNFYLSFLRRAVNSTLNRILLGHVLTKIVLPILIVL